MKSEICFSFRFAVVALSWVLAAAGGVRAAAPDLTATNLASIVTTYNYNLGPTGMRGWLYREGANVGDFGTMTGQKPWQILVVTVGTNTPALGIMASNDVILGVSAGAGNVPVPLFTNDARKSLGWAIGAAEAGDGVLKLKRWRAGVTNDVSIQLSVIGAYSATAPFDCPKSALILSNAVNLITNKSFSGAPGGPVLGLALLATGDTNYLPLLQTYARSIAPANLALTGCDTWGWGYRNVFLAEYFLLTGDTNLLHGINEYTVGLAKGQSLYGTFGHGGAEQHADGSLHGSISWYGPVNSAGLVANLAIVMGRKCLVASGGVVHPEIDPAIERSAKFFGYYVGKGSIPYGEHEPWSGGHGSNGKDQMAALLFAMQDNRPVETEYFTRMSVAGYNGREYGHTGQGFSYLWGALAANVGGTNAVAAHLAQVRWHLDLSRRRDGSFVYDGAEQYGGSALYDYWGSATYAGIDPTASYVLTYALAKQKLLITGRNANPSNWLSSAVVSNAIWVGNFNLVCGGYDTNQLMAAMSEYDPGVRWWAATTLGTNTNTSVSALINLASHTNSRVREAACQALGVMKNTNALAVLGLRLTDTNIWVRSKAAKALKNFGTPALPELTNMLTAFITNATDPQVIVWEDPIQIANGYLADALFNTLGSSTIGVNTNLLYPAVRAGLQQPDGMALNYLSSFLQNRLTLTHVQAVAPSLIAAIAERSPADRMFSDSIRFAGLKTLGKYKIEEGIPLALMVKEQTWHGDDWTPFDQLQNSYRGAARDALPTLYAWQARLPQFAADGSIGGCCPDRLINISNKIASAIAAIVNDPAPPTLVNFKRLFAVNVSPSVVTLPTTSILLSTAASDLDGGVLNFSWSKVRGAGNVAFTPNGTAASNVVATFDTPGSYVLRLAAVDRSILNSNIWITYNLGYFDFQTYTNLIGAVYTNVTVTVSAPTNRAPVPQNQSLTTALDTAVPIALAATDPNGDAVTFILATSPMHGTLSGAATNLVYMPASGYTGFDGFTFTVNDGQVESEPATVTINVGAAGNRWPFAANQSVTTAEDTAKAITLAGTDADGNPLTFTIASPPGNGTLSGVPPKVTYLPATNLPAGNFPGSDSFTFVVNDASLTSAVAMVSITVTPVNDPPVAIPQSANVSANTAQSITLAGFDAEGYALLYTNASNPAHGTLSGTAPNLIYRPATNFHSADSFTFRVTDSEGAVSAVATVSITVSNEPPVANAIFLEVPPNSTSTITLTGRDNTGDPLSFTVLTQPANGLLSGTAPNLTYRPSTDFNGFDSFNFKVSDGVWDATNTVSITVMQWQSRTNIATGFWSVPASWAGGVPPAFGGGADYLLVFSTNVYSGSSTNDFAGTFQLNRLIFGSNLPAVTVFSNAFAFTNHAVTLPLVIQSGTSAHAFSNAVTLAANTTFGGSGSGKITLAGVVSGSGGLIKTNSGTLTLAAANTYSGGTIVSAGTLNPHGNGSGASRTYFGTGVVTLANGTVLKATDVSGQPVRIPSSFILSGGTVSVPIPFGGGTDLRLDGPVSGPGGFSISGGTRGLSLYGGNTFSGGVTLNDGNRVQIITVNGLGTGPLRLGNASGGSLNPSANLSAGLVTNVINLAAGGTLSVDTGGGSMNLAGSITNTGALTKNGVNTLTLSGVNMHSGNTTVNAGSLALSNSLALPNSTLILAGGTLTFAGSLTPFTLGGLSGSTAVSLVNAVGTPVLLTVGNNSTTYSGAFSGAGGLTKSGAGTLTLAGTNTFSGVTAVAGGILRLTNSAFALSTNTDVVLNSGSGTLNLGFIGTNLVNAVFINGTKQPVGDYGANGSTITGSGFLRVATAAASSRKDILTFSFPTFGAATLAGTNITLTVPYNTPVTSLAPTCTLSLLATASPVSGTARNFTTPQIYTVTAEDGSTRDYRVTVIVTPASAAKDILTFTFPTYGAATMAGTNIAMTVPYGAAVTNLAPTFTVSPAATASPVSGTARDFTTPHIYTVTAENGSTRDFRVTVNITPISSAKDILTFDFGALGPATIAGTNITITVGLNVGLTNLAPTFTVSPFASANPASGTTNNFTAPQIYTVTAQDGSTKGYLVTVQTYLAWQYSGSLYIITTPEGANLPGSASETNFPLLVRLNASFFNFSQAKAGGADLRFTTSAGATLAYQIEEWDAANGTASIWVRVPEIRGNARQPLVMYWGNSDATSQSSGPAVFNGTNGFLSVFHMNEALVDAVGTLTPTDNGTLVSAGMVGKARRFAAGTGINCGESITNFPTGIAAHSTEAWFRAYAVNADIVDWGTEGGGNKVQIKLVSPPRIHVEGNFANVDGISALALGQWYHVVHTYTNGTSRVYVNGLLDGTSSVTLTLANPARMWIGGWYNNYSFVGEIDEVRVSKVARSANWIKLQYENQKPLQTLVGNLVQAGTNFSVAPAQVTMNEGAGTNLTVEAGGAQKIFWISKRHGQETVLAVDQFTLNVAAGRVTGDQSFVIQFKAVYPTEIKTNDIPVTVTEFVPDPVFTLTASTNLWDGRQTMTVTPDLSNWSALLARGATNLNYTWTVSGVAVIKQITGGTLTLLRAQGSGPMTVRLVLNNGGTLITNTTTISVQEPATEAWVQRTPAANEVPVHGQFYARDDPGFGTLHYNGTLGGSPSSVFLRVFTNGPAGDVLYTNLIQSLAGGAYAFTARLAPGLITYSVQFGSVTAGVTNVLNTVTNLICGDAYVIHGQSNAEATAPGNEAVPYTNRWIRSYNGGWNNAIRAGNNWHIGYWGMDLATNLLLKYQVPICIINGGVGGTRIDQHQPNPTNHFDTSAGYSLYGNLLVRGAAAKLTHGIRAVLWHQGEQDQGSEGPTGDFNWKSYQQFFVDISAAWKQDFPNLRYYYVYQIWPAACGDTSANDMLREVQRTLPSLYSNMRLMTTVGIVPGSSCHYLPAGYVRFAELISPLLEKDLYGLLPGAPITAPDLKRASFTTTNRNEIALEFGQDMGWNNASKNLFFLDGVAGKVASGSVAGKVIKLQLTAASTNETITYLKGIGWDGVQANLLYGSNGIAALTFAAVPIAPPVSGSLTNTTASGITTTSAVLRVTLSAPGSTFAVQAFWNTVNGGTNAALWTNSAFVGAWTNVAATNLNYVATGLTPGTPYYFTFRATNNTEVLWATNVLSFTTLTLPPAPILSGGAVTMAGGVPTFNFLTVAGYKYRLVFKNTLPDATWLPVIEPPGFPSPDGWSATSTGAPMSITDSGVAGMAQRFYRLEAAYP